MQVFSFNKIYKHDKISISIKLLAGDFTLLKLNSDPLGKIQSIDKVYCIYALSEQKQKLICRASDPSPPDLG